MLDIDNYLDEKIRNTLVSTYFLEIDLISKIITSLTKKVRCDLDALKEKDPALSDISHQSVFKYSTSFKSVFNYRISNELLSLTLPDNNYIYKNYQKTIEETGIDIHPKAIIGKRFVLDHGTGTVIGATSIIGDDCYFLGNITLGAKGISKNKNDKRHPTVGNHVQIASGVKVIGNIKIGDNVFLSPNTLILKDIPDNNRVVLSNLIQVNTPFSSVIVYGVIPENFGFVVIGDNLDSIDNVILTIGNKICDVDIVLKSKNNIQIHIYSYNDFDCSYKGEKIILTTSCSDIIIHSSHALDNYRKNITRRCTQTAIPLRSIAAGELGRYQ